MTIESIDVTYGTEKPKTIGEFRNLLETIASDLEGKDDVEITNVRILGNSLSYTLVNGEENN